jgi:hypothetical protein
MREVGAQVYRDAVPEEHLLTGQNEASAPIGTILERPHGAASAWRTVGPMQDGRQKVESSAESADWDLNRGPSGDFGCRHLAQLAAADQECLEVPWADSHVHQEEPGSSHEVCGNATEPAVLKGWLDEADTCPWGRGAVQVLSSIELDNFARVRNADHLRSFRLTGCVCFATH